MREIPVQTLSDTVRALYLTANYQIGADIESAVRQAQTAEKSPIGQSVLCQLC